MFAFLQDVPINAAAYERIEAGLGTEPPPGLVVHLAIERPEGGLRYIDVWESQEQLEDFTENRLHPVVHPILEAVFGDRMPEEPERKPLSVVHVWKP